MLSRFAVVFVSLLLTACAAHVEGLHQDAGFNYPALRAGGLAVAGVASAVEPLQRLERSRYASLLERTLREKRPAMELLSAGGVEGLLGADDYRALMAAYEARRSIRPEGLADLGGRLPVRYIVFARIEADLVERERSEDRREITKENENGKQQETGRFVLTVSHDTRRELLVAFDVYDLRGVGVVWSGALRPQRTETRRREREFDSNAGWGERLLEELVGAVLVGQAADPWPAPTPFERLIEEAFAGFAENLPEAP